MTSSLSYWKEKWMRMWGGDYLMGQGCMWGWRYFRRLLDGKYKVFVYFNCLWLLAFLPIDFCNVYVWDFYMNICYYFWIEIRWVSVSCDSFLMNSVSCDYRMWNVKVDKIKRLNRFLKKKKKGLNKKHYSNNFHIWWKVVIAWCHHLAPNPLLFWLFILDWKL